MGVTRFTASGSNRVKFTTLAQALKDVSDGAHTLAMGVKRATDDANFHGFSYLLSGTGDGTVEAGVSINGSDALIVDADGYSSTGQAITGTTERYVVVMTKGAGNAAVTYDRYTRSNTTWSATSTGGTRVDQIDATMLEIGAWQNGDFFDGWIPWVAWWEGQMSFANRQALVTNWRTSDLWNSAHGQPVFLVEGNVTGASLVDLAGNASGLTVTGTSLDAAETFDSWTFDGTGSGSQNITPGHLASGAQIFAPSFQFGSVTIQPGHVASTAQVFAPALAQVITPGHVASTAQLFSPTLAPGSVTVQPAHLASGEQVFAPSVGGSIIVEPGHVTSAEQVFAPTLAVGSVTITPGFVASGAQVFQPSLSGGDAPGGTAGQRPTLGVG